MARTLLDLVNIIIDDTDEDSSDSTLKAKLKRFVNRGYKEVAKREKLDKSISVTSIDGQITKPNDFYRIVELYDDNYSYSCQEEDNYISTSEDGEMTLVYQYIPSDLGDNDTPLTNPGNDEAITHYAKHLYYKAEDEQGKAEASLRDFEMFNIHTRKKNIKFTVVR